MNNQQIQSLNDMETALLEKGCKILRITTKSEPMYYICVCGTERKQTYKDFITRNCRSCKTSRFVVEDIIEPEERVEDTGEIWKRIPGGWISSFGRAKNHTGKILTLCPTKFRYRLNKKHEYASRLVAKALF